MLVDINKIKVHDRIRKEFGDIEELAKDIKDNGLINPPVVTPEFELIAGERRLRACKLLELKEIEVRVMTVKDYEHQLKIEISENEHRKEFTFSERVEWAKRLEQVEKIKAKERMSLGGQGKENFPTLQARDAVADQAGFGSGKQYEKAKFIEEHADPDIIQKLNEEKISIHKAYLETKAKMEAAQKKVQELEARPPEVVEKTVVKEVAPADYHQAKDKLLEIEDQLRNFQKKIDGLEHEKMMLNLKVSLNEKDAAEYNKLKKEIKNLHSQRDDLHRQIESATSLAGLVVEIENLLQNKLAPVKYSRAVHERMDSEVAVRNLDEIVTRVEEWCRELRSIMPNGKYIEAEVISCE